MQETRVRKKSGFLFDYVAKLRYRIPAANSYIGSAYFRVSICSFQVSHQDPGQGFKLQFPSFKFQTKFQVRVSSCTFRVSSFKPRSRSGFQVAISKFQDSHQDLGQGLKLQFPSFKIQTKIQVRVPFQFDCPIHVWGGPTWPSG